MPLILTIKRAAAVAFPLPNVLLVYVPFIFDMSQNASKVEYLAPSKNYTWSPPVAKGYGPRYIYITTESQLFSTHQSMLYKILFITSDLPLGRQYICQDLRPKCK